MLGEIQLVPYVDGTVRMTFGDNSDSQTIIMPIKEASEMIANVLKEKIEREIEQVLLGKIYRSSSPADYIAISLGVHSVGKP